MPKLDPLEALRQNYKSLLPKKLKALCDMLRDYQEDMLDIDKLNNLTNHIHKLSGSAGTYGFSELGKKIRSFEILITKEIQNSGCITTETLNFIINEINTLDKNFLNGDDSWHIL